jgi:hypothetical protein
VRALLLQGLSAGSIHLRRLDSSHSEDSDRVGVLAVMSAGRRSDGVLEQIVGRGEPRTFGQGSPLAG